MPRECIITFLDFTPEDVQDFVTLRRWLDNRGEQPCLIKEKELKDSMEEVVQSTSVNEIPDQTEKNISFPYQSFFNLRYWRKAPKSLKKFFQALTCFFSPSNQRDFLTELKVNHRFIQNIKSYRPSTIVIDEFRTNYLNSEELSLEYIRKKSFDAYNIALWIYQQAQIEYVKK